MAEEGDGVPRVAELRLGIGREGGEHARGDEARAQSVSGVSIHLSLNVEKLVEWERFNCYISTVFLTQSVMSLRISLVVRFKWVSCET